MKLLERMRGAYVGLADKLKSASVKTSLYLPGMRVNKTVIAVFICWLISYATGNDDYVDAPMATVLTMQASMESSFREGFYRVLGTLLAGGYAILIVDLLLGKFGLGERSLLFMALSAISLIPFSFLILLSRLNKAMSISIIVFIVIIANAGSDLDQSTLLAINRALNTAIGVIVAMFINWLPLLNRKSPATERDIAPAKEKDN